MDQETESRLVAIVKQRIEKQADQIAHSLKQIAAGNPLGSEPLAARSIARIAAKTKLPTSDAAAMTNMIARTAKIIDATPELPAPGLDAGERSRTVLTDTPPVESAAGAEALQGPTIDLVGVEFLSRGRLAANAVGRVAFRSGRAQGSGFLVGPGLLLTNNHVIRDTQQAATMMVQFDYEAGDDGLDRPVTSFAFESAGVFVTDPIEGLDFTLISIGERISGSKSLESFGYIPLSDAKDKHMLGELANIIQHPQGDLKQLVVRENNLISRDETANVLHYLADTERGSSGSPVCNNNWEPIALHHWGEPYYEVKGVQGQVLRKDVNEGIRISAIVRALRDRATSLSGQGTQRLRDLLALWDSSKRSGPVAPSAEAAPATTASEAIGREARSRSDGSITWTFPIEISVRAPLIGTSTEAPVAAPAVQPPAGAVPGQGPERAARRAIDFSDRGGYEPGFIPGFVIPLPDYSGVDYRMAKNQRPLEGAEDLRELPYHHFSVFINADRRLLAFTACNIDGRRLAAVNRKTKDVNLDPTLSDLGAEASDDFQTDPRILDAEQMGQAFYKDQVVPGYPKPPWVGPDGTEAQKRSYTRAMNARTARMLQKGHITLRGDPAWGTAEEALAAEADTFFYTNAAPQFGFFNQGSPENRPAAKGKLRWRAVETYVLRNAFTSRKRVTVFAGTVFDDVNDPPYRQKMKLPMQFWKVVVWADSSRLRSIALLASQRPVYEALTEGVPEAADKFEDEEELARVTEFLSTVAEVERLTGLDFGKAVRNADVRSGGGSESIADAELAPA